MSGLVRSVGKVFRKVAKSKVVKGLAIAAALYYAGGLAAGAMGSTTAANLPGIKGLADFLGVEAGAFGETGPPPLDGLQTTPLPDNPLPQGTDLSQGPDAAAEMAQAQQPPAQPAAAAPAAQAAPSQPPAPPPTAGATPTAQVPGDAGVPKSALTWWQGLSPGAQQILAKGFAGGAAGMMQALAAKNAQEDAEAREERFREDRRRRGAIPDFSSGIIDRARKG
jgi:hypothetical protein